MERLDISWRQILLAIALIFAIAAAIALAYQDSEGILQLAKVLAALGLLAIAATLVNLTFFAPILTKLGRMTTSKNGFWTKGYQSHRALLDAEYEAKRADLLKQLKTATDSQVKAAIELQIEEEKKLYRDKVKAADRNVYGIT